MTGTPTKAVTTPMGISEGLTITLAIASHTHSKIAPIKALETSKTL